MILLIDNYDSFTYNIAQAFSRLHYPLKVVRSDKITIAEIASMKPSHIIIGPGPGKPQDAGISIAIVQHFAGKCPILGICLGHQAILAAFGTSIINAQRIVHGKVESIKHHAKGIFRHIKEHTKVARYHSLVGNKDEISEEFIIAATSLDGDVLAVEHSSYHLIGLQFHPESIGTEDGERMLLNFLHYQRELPPMQNYLKKALMLKDFTFKEAYDIMDELTQGDMTDAQIGALFSLLEVKGVNGEELAGFASLLKKKAVAFPLPQTQEKRLDIVGTGGSSSKTFNVSTTSSLLLASAGVNIIKHGNKAVTSKSGSADLLEALGMNINMTVEQSIALYEQLNFTFLYAVKYHAALRFASNARKSLGFKTAFNLLGPLSNPANVTHQFIGVFDKQYTEIIAEALSILGIKRAMVVSGFDGYDEISLCAPTKITELNKGSITSYDFTPMEIGLEYVEHSLLTGGDKYKNLHIAMDIFNNISSPKLDLVALNMACGLYLYDMCNNIRDGFFMAKDIIASKKVFTLLEAIRAFCHHKI